MYTIFQELEFELFKNTVVLTTVVLDNLHFENKIIMLRRRNTANNAHTLARRNAMMPSLHKASSESGSMPFWLITTKVFLLSAVQTFRFNSKMAFTCAYGTAVYFDKMVNHWPNR